MANTVTATIEKGMLVVRIPAITKNCPVSASGKTKRVASTEGNVATELEVEGKKVTIGLNAYISNK